MTSETTCPQCEADTTFSELHRNEGVCQSCCDKNQSELDRHNFKFAEWNRLSDRQRGALIKREIR